jgi:hypothetical protein
MVVPKGRLAFERFDLKQTAGFSERSVSEETRRAYRRVVREFFLYFKGRHPALITSREILECVTLCGEGRRRPRRSPSSSR